MTWGFLASFGGLVFALGVMLVAEKLFAHWAVSSGRSEDPRETELAAVLRRAEVAARQTEEEIARARSIAAS